MQIVPQYIDVEDKVAGPLTWKHIGWFFGGGAILLFAFVTLDNTTFIIAAIPIALMTAALAFYKPSGVPLVQFIGYGFSFLFRPKMYVWQREMNNSVQKRKKKDLHIETTSTKKQLTVEDMHAIAQTLDTHGKERNERIQQLIKERTQAEQHKK